MWQVSDASARYDRSRSTDYTTPMFQSGYISWLVVLKRTGIITDYKIHARRFVAAKVLGKEWGRIFPNGSCHATIPAPFSAIGQNNFWWVFYNKNTTLLSRLIGDYADLFYFYFLPTTTLYYVDLSYCYVVVIVWLFAVNSVRNCPLLHPAYALRYCMYTIVMHCWIPVERRGRRACPPYD